MNWLDLLIIISISGTFGIAGGLAIAIYLLHRKQEKPEAEPFLAAETTVYCEHGLRLVKK